jgi:hypothetical protein
VTKRPERVKERQTPVPSRACGATFFLMRRLLLLLLAALPAFAQDVLRIESKVLGETRQILVRTPASYANGAQRYPVVYMTDGDRQLAHTAATADFLAREGRMPEVILVGISTWSASAAAFRCPPAAAPESSSPSSRRS